MKQRKLIAWLPAIVLVLSVLVLSLYRWLYAVALDEKGLLISRHPLAVCLWTAVFAGAVLILLAVRKSDGSNLYEDNFTPSALALLGHLHIGITVVLMALLYPIPLGGIFASLWKVLGVASGIAMIWGGICRKRGTMPFFGIHAGLCLFLLLYLVSCYQFWSGNPQLQGYVFELLALVAMVLYCYQLAALAAGMGNRKALAVFGLLTVLLSGPANFGARVPALYASGLLFAATNLCRLAPPPKNREENTHESA